MTEAILQKKSASSLEMLPEFEGVCYLSENYSIYGSYTDILSAYRAKKAWLEVLKFNYSFSEGRDVSLSVEKSAKNYILTLNFASSNAQDVFWRITKNMEPEVQYTLETAHIPMCEKRYEEILTAPDLCSVFDVPLVKSPQDELKTNQKANTLINKVLS